LPRTNLRLPALIVASIMQLRNLLFTGLLLMLVFAVTPLPAQKRAEVGVFFDYLSISQTGSNNFGLGGRFGYRAHRNLMIEGEVAYDYGINFDEAFRNVVNGNLVAIERTSVGVTHGLFGVKVQPSHGHFQPFATMKAGFMDFRLSPSLLPINGVVSSLLGLRTSTLNAAIYPGGGFQATAGPVGLRFEVGDEIYFNRGTHNNFRLTFGPIIRF
jgi:hypothetical protein